MLALITEDAISETIERLQEIPAPEAVEAFAEEQPNVVAYAMELFSGVEDEALREKSQASTISTLALMYEFLTTQAMIEEEEEMVDLEERWQYITEKMEEQVAGAEFFPQVSLSLPEKVRQFVANRLFGIGELFFDLANSVDV